VVTRPDIQQALLKPAYARLYPGIPANEWLPLAVMLELVRASKGEGGSPPASTPQGLDPQHFSFRGTASAGSKESESGRRAARRKLGPSE
jgi:hypothetical protein